jgi:hypothetical protein
MEWMASEGGSSPAGERSHHPAQAGQVNFSAQVFVNDCQ